MVSLHQSSSPKESVKPVAHPIWFIPLCSVRLINMVNSLQVLVLYSVPLAVLFDMLKTVWHLPLRKDCERPVLTVHP